jgi:hypothetical protein
MSVPVVVGTRFALEPGRGSQAVPVRSALFGAVIGVLGVLAALTFSSGVGDAVGHPERFGQTNQVESFFGFNNSDFGPVDKMLPLIARDADVVSVNDTRIDVGQVGDVSVSVVSLDPVREALEVVVTRGRLPDRQGEVALAPRTAKALGADLGDSLELSGTRGRQELAITGLAFVPAGPHNDYATGAWVTRQTYDDLFGGFRFHAGLIALRAEADPKPSLPASSRAPGKGPSSSRRPHLPLRSPRSNRFGHCRCSWLGSWPCWPSAPSAMRWPRLSAGAVTTWRRCVRWASPDGSVGPWW